MKKLNLTTIAAGALVGSLLISAGATGYRSYKTAQRAPYQTTAAYAGVNELSERLNLGRPASVGMPVQDFLDAVARATEAATIALEERQAAN